MESYNKESEEHFSSIESYPFEPVALTEGETSYLSESEWSESDKLKVTVGDSGKLVSKILIYLLVCKDKRSHCIILAM